jgi:hypothetical protein
VLAGASVSAAKKFAVLWCLSILVGLFKAFVLLNLWNWFVVDAFHVPSISFLPMLGIVWFVQLVTEHPNRDSAFCWRKAYALLDFCIPEDKREATRAALAQLDGEMWEELWVGVGQQIFGAATALALGFCVHLLA